MADGRHRLRKPNSPLADSASVDGFCGAMTRAADVIAVEDLRIAKARAALRRAGETFSGLGMLGFAQQAGQELRPVGGPGASRSGRAGSFAQPAGPTPVGPAVARKA